jgi:hypothetical protein
MSGSDETFNPWSVVNLVFHHLAGQGLHPVLGPEDPGAPAAALLSALGVRPAPEGNRQVSEDVRQQLADLRDTMLPRFETSEGPDLRCDPSHETAGRPLGREAAGRPSGLEASLSEE